MELLSFSFYFLCILHFWDELFWFSCSSNLDEILPEEEKIFVISFHNIFYTSCGPCKKSLVTCMSICKYWHHLLFFILTNETQSCVTGNPWYNETWPYRHPAGSCDLVRKYSVAVKSGYSYSYGSLWTQANNALHVG